MAGNSKQGARAEKTLSYSGSRGSSDSGVSETYHQGVPADAGQVGAAQPTSSGCGAGSGIFFLLFFLVVLYLMMKDTVLNKKMF